MLFTDFLIIAEPGHAEKGEQKYLIKNVVDLSKSVLDASQHPTE
jgi:hypothetical protein